jgi:hypothetical protein
MNVRQSWVLTGSLLWAVMRVEPSWSVRSQFSQIRVSGFMIVDTLIAVVALPPRVLEMKER